MTSVNSAKRPVEPALLLVRLALDGRPTGNIDALKDEVHRIWRGARPAQKKSLIARLAWVAGCALARIPAADRAHILKQLDDACADPGSTP